MYNLRHNSGYTNPDTSVIQMRRLGRYEGFFFNMCEKQIGPLYPTLSQLHLCVIHVCKEWWPVFFSKKCIRIGVSGVV